MDFFNTIEVGSPFETRLRMIVRDTALFVIDSEPSLNEDARARARPLRIPVTKREDFTSQVGRFMIQGLLKLRRYPEIDNTRHPSVPVHGPLFFKDFTARCRKWFSVRQPQDYFQFLICEFCCKVAEEARFEEYFCSFTLEAEYYMHLLNGVFPTIQELIMYIEFCDVEPYHAPSMPPGY